MFLIILGLVKLMITTSPNMSDLERAYSRLEKITTKRRNQLKIDNLETLFVSANLQVPVAYEVYMASASPPI